MADSEIRVLINPLPKEYYSVQRVTYSLYNPDLLALTRKEQTTELWNTAVGLLALLTALKIPPHCSSILLLEDDKLITAVASKAYSIHLFETDPGSSLDLAYGHEEKVRAVKVSPTSNMVASADHEMVILWDVNGGSSRPKKKLGPYRAAFRDLAFSSDGKFLAAGHGKAVIKLWNLEHIEGSQFCKSKYK